MMFVLVNMTEFRQIPTCKREMRKKRTAKILS